jgi:hypothetical protein
VDVATKLQGLPPQQIIAKYNMLKSKRGMTESVWQGIGDYIIPRKNDIQTYTSPGSPKYVDLYDSTGVTSNELLAGALHGMLTNPAGYFFNLTTGDPAIDGIDEVRFWLHNVVRKIHDRLNNSNFQTEIQELYLDLCAFGTSAMSIEEDDDTVVRFATRPLKEIFIDENSKGQIDCVYRFYCMNSRGLVDDFGLENLPEEIQKEYNSGKEKDYEMLHAIYPSKIVRNKQTTFKYLSHYVLVGKKLDLDVQGFREFPFVVPRWSKAAGEQYGRGPGEKALPEVKTLNKMTETTLKGAQKVVDPPLQAPDDGFVLPLITRPAGLNYYRAGSQDRIEPIFNGAQIDFGYQAIELKKGQVREAFYIDQLKLREGPQMTATEVMERTEQALRFLGPMLGRQQSELLQPMVERIYAIMDRRGEIPEAPAELQDQEIKVRYSSVMAMAQRASELQNVNRFFSNLAPLMGLNPNVADNINTDNATHGIARILNFPQDFLNTKDEVTSIRDQRAKAQQEAAQAAMDATKAESASKVVGAAAKMQPSQGGA